MLREMARGVGDGMEGGDGGMRIVLDINFYSYLFLYIAHVIEVEGDVPIR